MVNNTLNKKANLWLKPAREEATLVLPEVEVAVGVPDNRSVGRQVGHWLGVKVVVLGRVDGHRHRRAGQRAHVTGPKSLDSENKLHKDLQMRLM